MKLLTIIGLTILSYSINLNAQDSQLHSGFGAGFQLVQYQNDFGFGLNLTSPLLAKNRLGFRVKSNLMFNEHLKNGDTTWSPYGNISIGMMGIGGVINERIRLYGEGGIIALLPSSEFSSENMELGGYGLFGFEFFFSNFGNYFIEIGGVGTGAKADNLETKPIYSNGLTLSVGFRVYYR